MKAEDVIYAALIANESIKEQTYGRIKFYEYPETGDVSGPHIIIDPLSTPRAADYADNTWLTWDYLFQLDVWSKNRKTTDGLMKEVHDALWEIGFSDAGSGTDEYDEVSGIFRQVKRFEGKIYRNQIKGEKING